MNAYGKSYSKIYDKEYKQARAARRCTLTQSATFVNKC